MLALPEPLDTQTTSKVKPETKSMEYATVLNTKVIFKCEMSQNHSWLITKLYSNKYKFDR